MEGRAKQTYDVRCDAAAMGLGPVLVLVRVTSALYRNGASELLPRLISCFRAAATGVMAKIQDTMLSPEMYINNDHISAIVALKTTANGYLHCHTRMSMQLLVGYNTTSRHWTLKNSWGTGVLE
jgi:hypothetical protein